MPTQEIPGLDSLGAGYDIFGPFESPKSVTHPLVDWSGFHDWTPDDRTYRRPQGVDVVEDAFAERYAESGWTFEEYCEKLNTKTKLSGGYAFFNASLEIEFKSEVLESHEHAYTSVFDRNTHFHLKLDPSTSLGMVKPAVKNALRQLPPSQLFDIYGTHYVNSLTVGTKAVATYTTDKSRFSSTEQLKVAAKMSYESFARLSAEFSTDRQTAIQRFNESSTRHIRAYGGRAEQGTQCESYAQWKAWADTAHLNPMFIGFVDDRSLLPIWELCTDAARRRILSAEYDKYAAEKTTAATDTTAPAKARGITDVRIIMGDNPDIQPGRGWTKINKDLNAGAGGEFIYLAYKKEAGKPPLTKLIVQYADSTRVNEPDGFQVVRHKGQPADLNKGAGGRFIYLFQSRAPSEGGPIKALRVDVKNETMNRGTPGWEFLRTDLNKGAGGKFIYLSYRH